jgi:predicted enzyme related to lactoylglutathione lyase
MITNISLFTVYVTDQDEAKAFYQDVLGFVERTDIQMGEGFRWVTVGHPSQPELEVTLMVPGPPLDDHMADAVRRSLANGSMGGFGLTTDDCRKTYEELSAKGVVFVQEPAERPYGIEAVMRDNSGNWLVLVEPREFTPGDFAEPA